MKLSMICRILQIPTKAEYNNCFIIHSKMFYILNIAFVVRSSYFYLTVPRQIQDIKGCLVQQIFFK